MSFPQSFQTMPAEQVLPLAKQKKEEGWRFVQIHTTNTLNGVDVIYSYMKDGVLEDWKVVGVLPETHLESITSEYFNAFVFENEAHDLFGVHIDNIVLDFQGTFYDLAIKEPMTILSPAQKAKLDAEKAEKNPAQNNASVEDKLANLDPEKAAKVKAALEAKAKREAAAKGGN